MFIANVKNWGCQLYLVLVFLSLKREDFEMKTGFTIICFILSNAKEFYVYLFNHSIFKTDFTHLSCVLENFDFLIYLIYHVLLKRRIIFPTEVFNLSFTINNLHWTSHFFMSVDEGITSIYVS